MRSKTPYFFYFCLVISFLLGSVTQVFANDLKGIRVWPAPHETRVVIDLNSAAKHSYFLLSSPNRLVVDIHNTQLKMKLPKLVKGSDVLSKIRKSNSPVASSVRLVFELKKKLVPSIFTLPPAGRYGYRLVIDLPHDTPLVPSSLAKPHHGTTQPIGNSEIVVAIDAGHGGEDSGAVGPYHRYEKVVTLAIAKKVAAKINAIPGMKAILTRKGDYFISLNKRSEIARNKKAHLLVSIHADGFADSRPHGASVWVLSNRRANTEIGRWMEDNEKQSELLGGGAVLSKNKNDAYLSKAVLDLQFSFAQKEGVTVANNIINQLKKFAVMHKRQPQYASLAVLKSPDIPSLLVETGFITNKKESKLLYSSSYQSRLANAIYKGIYDYFKIKPPEGTLFAARTTTLKHKVISGESLSLIAQRYGTTMVELKRLNKLKSTNLYIGSTLLIPAHTKVSQHSTVPVIAKTHPVQTKVMIHTVKKGEFLSKIASRYKMSLLRLKQINHLRSSKIYVGKKLKVEIQAPSVSYITYVVRNGDYLSKVANKFKVSMNELKGLNHLKSNKLLIGQKLKVPNN